MATRDIPEYNGWRTANKDYICKGCGEKILKGIKYWRVADHEPPYIVQGAFCKPECTGKLQFFKKN